MPGFRFRLEVPLRVAIVERIQRRRDLAAAMRETEVAAAALRGGERRLAEAKHAIEQECRAGVTGEELSRLTAARDSAHDDLPSLRSALGAAQEIEQQARTRLAAASNEVEVLSRLRDEAWQAFVREEGRKEQTVTDDLVLVRRTGAKLREKQRRRSS